MCLPIFLENYSMKTNMDWVTSVYKCWITLELKLKYDILIACILASCLSNANGNAALQLQNNV